MDTLTRQSVRDAVKIGCKIACATGRGWRSAKPVIDALGIQSLCIIQGGTRIIDPVTEKVHWEKGMDDGASHQVLEIFKKHTKTGRLLHSGEPDGTPLQQIDKIHSKLSFMYLLEVPDETSRQIMNEVNLSGIAVAHITPSWYGGGHMDIHVTHPEATKGHAIKVWHELEDVTIAETIGMGDSGNDLPLFEASGFRVAVSNATDEIKTLADYIAPTDVDHALKHVIDRFLLN